MDFAIHKTSIQSDKHLVFVDNVLSESEELPQNTLVFGSTELEEVARLYLLGLPTFPSRNYIKALQGVLDLIPIHRVPWKLCLPERAFKRQLQDLVESLRSCLGGVDLTYWKTTYQEAGVVLSKLKPALINKEKYELYLSQDSSRVVKTFRQGEDGYTEEVLYDRTSTVTGRLKVVDGPNVLHLKKEYRDMIVSRFGVDGEIWSLDYKSLEPRILLSLSTNGTLPYRRNTRDIYQNIKDELFQGHDLTREQIKKVVLSEVYGAGIDTVSKELPNVERLENVVKLIREWFNLTQFKERLMTEAEKTNHQWLENCFGRRVSIAGEPPYKYPNRVVQSAAVDVALLGFSAMVRYLEQMDRLETVVPLFVLHDALICDVHKNALHLLPAMCKIGSVDIPRFEETRFYVQQGKFNG